jgi:GNAT superfamily N-acetyltransferase
MAISQEPSHPQEDVSIIPATDRHVIEIAGLHQEYISGSSREGIAVMMQGMLGDYYRELVARHDCAVYVAVHGGRVIGYASLVCNQRRVLLKLAVRRPRWMLSILTRFSLWPAMMGYGIRKVTAEFLGGKWPKGYSHAGQPAAAELRSVAVYPDWRGHSIAVRLLQSTMQYAVSKQWVPIVAWVEQCNSASKRAFVKAGFELAAQRANGDVTVNLYSWRPHLCLRSTCVATQ